MKNFTKKIIEYIDIEEGESRGLFCDPAPEKCDICSKNFEDQDYFIDGALKGDTKWAYMCTECFLENGEGIGLGEGQVYKRQNDGKWLMVGGFPDNEEKRFKYSCLYCDNKFDDSKSLEDDDLDEIICDKCYDEFKEELESTDRNE